MGVGARELIELIDRFGGARSASLKSAVYELEDSSTSAEKRLSAGAKLKAFAYSALQKGGEKLVDVGSEALLAYLQTKIGI